MAKIRYVEDSEDGIYLLSRPLRQLGFAIPPDRHGHKGIDPTKNPKADVIISDPVASALHGRASTRRRKTDPAAARQTPIYERAASAKPGEQNAARQAVADDFDKQPPDSEHPPGRKKARLPPGQSASTG